MSWKIIENNTNTTHWLSRSRLGWLHSGNGASQGSTGRDDSRVKYKRRLTGKPRAEYRANISIRGLVEQPLDESTGLRTEISYSSDS